MERGRFFAAMRLRMTMGETCRGEHEVRPYRAAGDHQSASADFLLDLTGLQDP